jgi:hypothetical protein
MKTRENVINIKVYLNHCKDVCKSLSLTHSHINLLESQLHKAGRVKCHHTSFFSDQIFTKSRSALDEM